MSSGKTTVALLPPTPLLELPEADDDGDAEGEEGPSETEESEPPSTARETTEECRALWLRSKAKDETGADALDVATPPRTATIDGDGGSAAPKETPAERAPQAFPRAAARMVATIKVWKLPAE